MLLRLFLIIVLFICPQLCFAGLKELGICRSNNDTFTAIKKLICVSTPAFIEAASRLILPSCDKAPQPALISGEKPVSAVFVVCSEFSKKSCLEIAKSISNKKTGATVNIVVHQNLLKDSEFIGQATEVTQLANSKKTPINFIPVSSASPQTTFLRDYGVFENSNQGPKYSLLPHSQLDSEKTTREVLAQCGLPKLTPAYLELSSFDTAYASLSEVAKENIKNKLNENAHASNMGGNLLALPDGTIVVGKSPPASREVLDYFRKSAKVVEVDLPKLEVSHIDEVFNIVPNPDAKLGECNFTLLRASPKAMKDWISLHPSFSVEPNTAPKFVQSPYKKLLLEIENAESQGRPTDSLKKRLPDLEKAQKEAYENDAVPAQELFNLNYDENDQKIIDESTDKILGILKKSYANCKPPVVDLPVYWDKGKAKIPNPVNGLHVNGTYFMSEQNSRFGFEDIASFKQPELQSEIVRRLSPYFPNGVVSVNTQQYDWGYGNMHCATTNIYLPCK